jgi:3-hydroxyisobutyrate dehydrogenase-like beta-hydroxyacid dehydrogenase
MASALPRLGSMTRIAILGTGHMGAPIARRLLALGHPVTVWNRTAARVAPLAEAGARVAATPAEAVDGAEVVILMLSDGPAVEAALFGAIEGRTDSPAAGASGANGSGAVGRLDAGACVVQMSTIGPDEARAVAARLPVGVAFVDAPVGGSVAAAGSGGLTIFAGGDDAAIARAEPVLRELGTLRRCGAVGTGSALKLVVNTAMIGALAVLRDTLRVADAAGIDRDVALAVLATGPLAGAISRAGATGVSFAIALAAKDVRLSIRGVDDVPVAAAALHVLDAAPDQQADVAALIAPTVTAKERE